MSDKFPCCICQLPVCGGSRDCPFLGNDFPFEDRLISMVEEEIPEVVPEDKIKQLLKKNCRGMSEREIFLLISQIN